ncbi:cell wall integrity and stress response component 4-like [Haliotis rufescens]|uniref:cell wall integrity and stress response component 4-like n=1 Tax=Haliotis rufescens TaxID=6454 RepID=UPI00201E852E|nr:cell wall integrity and stress response component 4-like [Haliotis rufescens]
MPTTTTSSVFTTSPPVSPISVSSSATTSSTKSSTKLLDAAGTAIPMPTTTTSSVFTTSPPVSPISVSSSATSSSTTSSTKLLDAAGTDPGTTRDNVTSLITPILVSCVVIAVVLCVTVVITSYIRKQQGPNHKEENRNQSERHYAGLESGHGDADYSSLNSAYEEFPNTLPDPAPPNTTDSTGHSLYANEGIESQMRDLNPDRVVYANGDVQME